MRLVALLAALAATTGLASTAKAQTGGVDTKFEYLDQSLESLLNAGAQVKSSALMGQIILMRGDKTIICQINVPEATVQQMTTFKTAKSQCFALN